jgi:3-phosphoshikimate 1-carboxyvinyltransferase
VIFRQAARIRGEIRVPGDKSISHRALVLAALAEGSSHLVHRAPGFDQDSMVACLRALGVEVSDGVDGTTVAGVGLQGLVTPPAELDCGNSGATLRFLTGALAGVDGIDARLSGDASLRSRPMARIAEPLGRMGAEIEVAAGGVPPLRVRGRRLRGAAHDLPVASAQVKTALLLAGLNAEGETSVREPAVSRDHTERLLRRLGVDLRSGERIVLVPPARLGGFELAITGDPSSAAFWAVLAATHPRAELAITGVCLNPTRTGFLSVLGRMGARIDLLNAEDGSGEATADLVVRTSALHGTEVSADEAPSLIDEVPVLAVAATQAGGETVFRGLGELRIKESDRLAAIARELGKLGAAVQVEGNDLHVAGGAVLRGAQVSSGGDHRMAMALAVAANIAEGETEVDRANAASISYPDFFSDLDLASV